MNSNNTYRLLLGWCFLVSLVENTTQPPPVTSKTFSIRKRKSGVRRSCPDPHNRNLHVDFRVTHQAVLAQCVVQSLGSVTGHVSQPLLHRPFFAFWFMGQISRWCNVTKLCFTSLICNRNRALSLWERDNSLTLALDVGTSLLKPIDYLSALWPCPGKSSSHCSGSALSRRALEQRYRLRVIREQLATACRKAGRPQPPPNPPDIVLSN
jgi:hypothetical protein